MKRGQGFLFSIEIIEDFIKFRFLGFILWAKVKLEEVEYMRISSKSEYYDCVGAGEKALYWPIMIWGYSKRMAPIYMLERSRDGKKFFFRARSAFHYKLRTEIGRARSDGFSNNHSPW